MPLLPTLSYSLLSGVSGWCLGTQFSGRQRRQQIQEFQEEVLAEINERYDSYLELEARISRAIKQFDLEEERHSEELARRQTRIQELEQALDRSVDHAQAEGGALTALETALSDFLEESGVAPALDALGRRDLELEIGALRGELARSRSEKDQKIQHQQALIGQLTESVARFEAEVEHRLPGAETASVETPTGTAIADVLDEILGDDGAQEGWDHEGSDGSLAGDPGVRAALAESSVYQAVEAAFEGAQALERELDGQADAVQAAQREELEALRKRVEELAPYVERLARADQRIEELEQRCVDLNASRDEEVQGLRERVAEVEAEGLAREAELRESLREQGSERAALEQELQELAPVAERLRERDEECARLEQLLEDSAPLTERLEASEQAREQLEQQVAELAPIAAELQDKEAACQQLEETLAELSPMAERVRELEDAGTQRDLDQAEEVRVLQSEVARLEAQIEGKPPELTALRAEHAQALKALKTAQKDVQEAEAQVEQLEQRCESIRSKKDEQIAALRGRIADLETVRAELDRKEVELGELEERCSSLERSKRRAAATTKRLREELAETEEVVREHAGDPAELRRERAERRQELLSLFDELDGVVDGMQSQERHQETLDGVYRETLLEQEREIDGLEARVRDLYLLMETVEDVVARLESKV